MRLPAVLLLATTMTPHLADGASDQDRHRPVRLAGLSESVPELFVKIVNDKLKGKIDAGSIRYDAPSSVVLQDARLLDPRGGVVARVKKARATLSLGELLSGEIVVSSVELDDPALDLVFNKDGKTLNLIEALTPKKPPEKDSKDPKTAFRIETIRVGKGSFTFTDKENVTITAAGIAATASLDIDLAREIVIVDVKAPTIASGKLMLKELDVPLSSIKARQVIVYKERVDLYDVSAKAAGASLTAAGSVAVRAPGNLAIHGYVDAPAGAWPDRLKPLPFELPAVKGKVDVTGPFENPLVAVDASFGEAKAYGYKVESGRGVVTVKKDLVTIKEGSAVKAGGGTVTAEGTVTLPAKQLDLRLRAADVPLATALMTAKLDPAPKGAVSARVHLTGVADGEAAIKVDAHGSARRVEIAGVKGRGDLTLDAKVTVKPKLVTLDAASLKGEGLEARVDGSIFTDEERLSLSLNARLSEAPKWVASVPEQVHLGNATFVGKIAGPFKGVVVEGDATGDNGEAYGVPFNDLRAHVAASAARVNLLGVSASAAGGSVSAQEIVVELKDKKALRGTVSAQKVNLAMIKTASGSAGRPLPLGGIADAEAILAGPYTDPTVTVRAAVGGLVVQDEKLGAATARLRVTKKLLTVIDADVNGPLLDAQTGDVRLGIGDKLTLDGTVSVARLDLSQVEAAKKAELTGTGFGVVRLAGEARNPVVTANLTVRDLAVGPQKFGDGPVRVGLAPDDGDGDGNLANVSAALVSPMGHWDATMAFAIQRKVINARVVFRDVDLQPFTSRLGTAISPLEGFVSGDVEASGPLDALTMRARARVPEVAVAPYRVGAGTSPAGTGTSPAGTSGTGGGEAPGTSIPVLRPLGQLVVEGRMDEGELVAKVCAFPAVAAAVPAADDGSPCHRGERVWANVVGTVEPMKGSFDLSVDGVVEEKALEDLIPAIARRGFRVGAKARAAAQIAKGEEKGAPVAVTAEATLLHASVQPPDEELRAELVEPANVLYDDRRVRLEVPAHFATPNREIDVTVGGAAGDEDIALDVEGSVALALAKLFTEQIANARGTAQTELSIRGRYDEGIAVEGSITPAPGSVVTPRSLGQPVQFIDGTVTFAPLEESGGMLRIRADGVHAKVGDGDAQLRGYADARTVREADEPYVARWDLALAGSGLSFRLPSGGRVEGGAELTLIGTEEAPTLRGRVELTDGSYRKSVELKNFVLAAAPTKQSEPLYQTLTPIGLGNLHLDVAVELQNFRVRFNAPGLGFDSDLLLGGNLRVNKLLRLPVIDGAIEVEEGEIMFPKARFEVVEMQVEFPSTPDGRLNPLVHLSARAEIPPGGAGNNDTEIPVDLFLDGDLEKGINIDLTATDPVRQWSRNDLLALVLFGKTSVEQTVQDADVGLAFDALLNEVSAPITAELEELAQATLGLELEIEATGWRWQLGRRLQVEGEVNLAANNNSTGTSSTATSAAASASSTSTSSSQTDANAVRLRLLIIDHLQPFGKNLSLEGRNASTGGDFRLSLRIFEY